jgi:hypothetical protein
MKNRTTPEPAGRGGDPALGDDVQRRSGPPSRRALLAFAFLILGLAIVLRPELGSAAAGCGLTSPAFCDTFDQGPSAVRGRGGDLDPSRWSAGRLAPSDFLGSVVNPVTAAPIPPCKASFTQTSVFPKDDTLICDPSGSRSAQLMTAVAIHNYGNNSYLIRQPFDFANRTGRIVFDVDAVSASSLATYIEIDLTDEPVPAPTFREGENFETGPVPKNGLMMKLSDNCASSGTAIRPGNTLVYTNYLPATITPSFTVNGTGCPKTRQGSLNHFEVQLSAQHVDIYGSDYSTDNGQTFPNFRKIYSADLSVPFTRGYVHVSARNHATLKYGFGPDFVYHWDNIGFDGPVVSNWRAYEIADNNTPGVNQSDGNSAIHNLGYRLLDGTNGPPAGIYDPVNRLGPFQFQGVDVSGAVAARLTMNAFFNAVSHSATTTWGWTFRFNGGTWRTRSLTSAEVQAINTAGSAGNTTLVMDVPVADVHAGSNTLEMLPVNAPMDYPPAVANIDLTLTLGAGSGPVAPFNLRIVP